jgi:transposase
MAFAPLFPWVARSVPGGVVLAKPLWPDDLWALREPWLPDPKPRRCRSPGRKPLGDRQARPGIRFVRKTGIPWEDLPVAMGWGWGLTCWRRLHPWQEAGSWFRRYQVWRDRLEAADKIAWARAAVAARLARACGGVEDSGPKPTDRGRPGVQQHLLVDAQGIPWAGAVTAANVPEVKELLPLVDTCGPWEAAGEPQRRPAEGYGDRALDAEPHRED